MDLKINACIFLAIGVVIAIIYASRKLKAFLSLRDTLTGSIIYIGGKVIFYQAEYALVKYIFANSSKLFQDSLLAILDSLIVLFVYVAIYKLFYNTKRDPREAFSLAFGAASFQSIFSIAYVLLSYGLMFYSLKSGNIYDVLTEKGYTLDNINNAVELLNNVSLFTIIFLFFETVLIFIMHIICSAYVYQSKKDKKMLIYALLSLFISDVIIFIIASLNVYVALALEAIYILYGYYIIANKDKSTVRLTYFSKGVKWELQLNVE